MFACIKTPITALCISFLHACSVSYLAAGRSSAHPDQERTVPRPLGLTQQSGWIHAGTVTKRRFLQVLSPGERINTLFRWSVISWRLSGRCMIDCRLVLLSVTADKYSSVTVLVSECLWDISVPPGGGARWLRGASLHWGSFKCHDVYVLLETFVD